MSDTPAPLQMKLRKVSRVLEVTWPDGRLDSLPFEYLRVFSPSAEIRGHGLEEPLLIGGKRNVEVSAVQPVGQYAVRLRFSDGHSSGLFSWPVLDELGRDQQANWARYLQRLAEMGMSRDSEVVKLAALPKKYRPGQS